MDQFPVDPVSAAVDYAEARFVGLHEASAYRWALYTAWKRHTRQPAISLAEAVEQKRQALAAAGWAVPA